MVRLVYTIKTIGHMESDKNKPASEENATPDTNQAAPADALSRTPDDLEEERVAQATESVKDAASTEKKPSAVRRFFRRVNVYLLLFVLIVIIAGIVLAVSYLNSQKTVNEPNIATQTLTENALKQLANSDATVGNSSQTLTIQGNAIIAGQSLMRGNLNVAGNIQAGGSIQGSNLTISGTSNLGTAQINTLQVANTLAVQGATTMRDLSVAGAASFSGAVTASQLTTSKLTLSGNAVLQVPNHLSFTGPTPGRNITSNVLGAGGSVSISGSDTSGTVNINTGNNPQPGCFTRITFQQAFTGQPRVIISPVGAGAGQTQYYVTRDQAGFSICTNNAAPTGQAFAFDYFVAG